MPSTSPTPVVQLTHQEVGGLADGIRLIARRTFDAADEVDEVVHETLVRALDALAAGRLRDRDRLGAFVRAIARHVITNELRRRARFEAVSDNLRDERASRDPLAAVDRADETRAVNAAFNTLSADDQHVINLSFVEGLEPTEIAKQTGEPPERIRKRKSRALSRLRDAFHRARNCHARPSPATFPHHD